MKIIKTIFIALFLSFLFSSCKKIKTIYVASYTADCKQQAPKMCLLVKENIEDEWTNLQDHIEGFTYEKGYTYKIEVSIEHNSESDTDNSKLKYSLIKIISKEKELSAHRNEQQTRSNVPYQITSVAYKAFSRGSFLNAKINKNIISLSKDKNAKKYQTINTSDENWKAISLLAKKVNIKNIDKLNAPSKKRLFDGAPHAQLKITLGRKTYTSSSFDHGNPPQELKQLVNTILSLTESIE